MKAQDTYQVQGIELLIPLPAVDSVIQDSPWTTRAWTFQEERLSRRKLYFTETQMYFRCSCAVFCEDSVDEGIDPSAFIFTRSNLWNSSGLYSFRYPEKYWSTRLFRTSIDDPVQAGDAYSRSVTQFSGRQISDPRDIIASFEGILSVLRSSLKTAFLFGLPEKYLDETLLWRETGPSSRRNISITPSSDTRFPSWSWAGWDTAVDFKFCNPIRIYPEVEWFVIHQSGEAIYVVTHGSYNNSGHTRITSIKRKVRPPVGPPDDFLKIVQYQAGISESKKQEGPRFLACWTCITSFSISDEDLEPSRKSRERLPVLDNRGYWAGSVFLGLGWKDNTKGNRGTFEFMLLSRSNELPVAVQHYDVDVFFYSEWHLLNVMLIQRDGDRAQRLDIGLIHEDAWVEANPVRMLIKLE